MSYESCLSCGTAIDVAAIDLRGIQICSGCIPDSTTARLLRIAFDAGRSDDHRCRARDRRIIRALVRMVRKVRDELCQAKASHAWDVRRILELQKTVDADDPLSLLRRGGKWLGAVRERIQWMRCFGNGESITWGSNEEVYPPLKMREVEELAAYAASGAIGEMRDKQRLRRENAQRAIHAWRDKALMWDRLDTIAVNERRQWQDRALAAESDLAAARKELAEDRADAKYERERDRRMGL